MSTSEYHGLVPAGLQLGQIYMSARKPRAESRVEWPSPALAALADLPRSTKLEKARAAHNEARQADELATAAFRDACAQLQPSGRWVRNDPDARDKESAAISAGAKVRLAANDVEAAKRAHSETLLRHFNKHTAGALDALLLILGEAHDAAQQIAKAVAAAEQDGGGVPYKLSKAARIARDLQNIIGKLA